MLVAIDECFRLDGSQLHLLNQAFLVLLPKKDAALDLADFRPISYVHSFPKLPAKVVANRLAQRLPELISPRKRIGEG